MKRIVRLFCMIVLLFAVTLSASGVVHASGAHVGHGAMNAVATSMDSHDHTSHDDHASLEETLLGSEAPDPLSCCIALAGACAGIVAFLPTVSLSEPSIGVSDPYAVSNARLSGIDPDHALRPPRA